MEPRYNAVFDPETSKKCENTVSTYDRADVLMGAGFSTFVSAALILVIPRVGIVLLELLLGLFFIGCALAARVRLRFHARSQVKAESIGPTNAKGKWFGRYDVLMIFTVIVIYASLSRLLRHVGLSEGTIGILPLILFAVGILLKPRIVQLTESRRKGRVEGRR
jgi:Flp pilus assembly protein TadB